MFSVYREAIVNVCYKFENYLATFAYCEFENKTDVTDTEHNMTKVWTFYLLVGSYCNW